MIKLFATVIFLIAFHCSGQAQTAEPSFTAVVVANIDSSIAWYAKVLDLKLRNRVDNASRGFKQAVLVNKGIMIEIVELPKAVSADSLLATQPVGTRILGFNKVGFTVTNIDSVFQRLSRMPVNFYGKMVTDAVNNKKTFLVTDPDGNLIQFFEK